jgi:F0F1-type ATP synthase assembly protein I
MKYNEASDKSQFGGVIVMKDNKETEEVEVKEGKEQNKREGNYVAEGMCLGMVIGMVIGSVTNNNPICMTLGMCVGLAAGTFVKKK